MIIATLIILFILLFAVIAVLTFARDVLVTILEAIVGFFRKGDRKQKNTEGKQTVRKRARTRKKVLSDTDGEYVDFEEVNNN
jgi:hypothetical protein